MCRIVCILQIIFRIVNMPLSCLIYPNSTTSKRVLSIASTIFFADCKDTSCSADLPPNTIPTRNFAILKPIPSNAKRIHYHDKTRVSRASAIMFMGCENGGRVRGKGFLIIVLLGGIGGLGYRYLPSYYNPFAPLQLADPPGWITTFKLQRLTLSQCQELLTAANQQGLISSQPVADSTGECPLSHVVRVRDFGESN